jgi:hypothetical protein
MFRIVTILLIVLAPLRADDLAATMRKVMEHEGTRPFFFDMQAVELRDMPYVYRYTATKQKLDKRGKVMESQTWSRDMIPIKGYLFQSADKPGAAGTQDREEKKYEKFENIPEAERAKREERWEKYRRERRRFWAEFLKAFTFERTGEETRNGRKTAVVRFTPKAGYQAPDVIDAKYLHLLQGRLWIDEEDLEIVRLDCEFLNDVKVGGGLFGKLYKGSGYSMELAKGFDGKWWPAHAVTTFSKRVVLSRSSERLSVTFSNYRKFGASSEIRLDPTPTN